MNEKHTTLDKRFSTTRRQIQLKSICTKQKQVCLNEIQCQLRKYLTKYWSTIEKQLKMKGFIDRQTFEQILRDAGLVINNENLQVLWDSCQPSENLISYEVFQQRFVAPLDLDDNQIHDKIIPENQCQILDYTTRISSNAKQNWSNIIEDFLSFDRYGRLFVTIDEAIKLMKKYSFPLNIKQQRELATLFSPEKNGQFHYYDFLKYFTTPLANENPNSGIFSPRTYTFQSKQWWTDSFVTIIDILNQIRSECIQKYGNIYRMFQKFDRNHQGYLTQIELKQLLNQLHIHLDDDEFYHFMCEIDRNQDGIITLDKLYSALVTNTLLV